MKFLAIIYLLYITVIAIFSVKSAIDAVNTGRKWKAVMSPSAIVAIIFSGRVIGWW